MADINFGILDTQLPGRIAAIPQEARKQQSANMLQAMQMQGAMREGQMSQMKIDEMLAERKEIDGLAAKLKEKGYTPVGYFTELLSSRNPTRAQQGAEGLRRLDEQSRFATIMGRKPTAPSVAPEPGSFGADMAARREADPFASRTNMLPGVAAGVNAMAGNAAEIEFKRQQRNDLIGMGTTQSIAAARAIDADIALLAKEPSYQNVPGVGLVNPRDRSVVMPSVEKPPAPPSMVAEYTFAKTPDGGGFRGSYQDFVTARAAAGRAPAQPRPEAAPRTQQVTMSNGGLGIVNMDTGVITPSTMGGAPVKGKPSAFAEKTALQRTQMGKDLTFAITQLTDITKDGGLIDQSTGSGAGRLTDVAARFVGQALPGDIAIGKIAPIADLALKMVPRFEGPQSNADTKSYNEAAGQLKDSSLPTKIRKEAGKVVLRIMQARKDQFATADMAAEGAPARGVDSSNPLLQ
jgi:hypothetical protein